MADQSCSGCGAAGAKFRCPCDAPYCGIACQTAQWETHKKTAIHRAHRAKSKRVASTAAEEEADFEKFKASIPRRMVEEAMDMAAAAADPARAVEYSMFKARRAMFASSEADSAAKTLTGLATFARRVAPAATVTGEISRAAEESTTVAMRAAATADASIRAYAALIESDPAAVIDAMHLFTPPFDEPVVLYKPTDDLAETTLRSIQVASTTKLVLTVTEVCAKMTRLIAPQSRPTAKIAAAVVMYTTSNTAAAAAAAAAIDAHATRVESDPAAAEAAVNWLIGRVKQLMRTPL